MSLQSRYGVKDLSESELLALAISDEETDGRIYADFAARLKDNYPATAQVFKEIEAEEDTRRRRLCASFSSVSWEQLTSRCIARLSVASVQSWIKPRRVAVAMASVRLTASSLVKMLLTCVFTVPSLINSSAPISLLLLPVAMRWSTSISR